MVFNIEANDYRPMTVVQYVNGVMMIRQERLLHSSPRHKATIPRARIFTVLRPVPLSVAACSLMLLFDAKARAVVPEFGYKIVHTFPHDTNAFTEGLFYLRGFFYESTGLEGHSSIRKVRIETGEVVQKIDVPPQYFGEGIVNWKQHLVSLTWKSEVGFVYDLATLKVQRQFSYPGEGWALTQDGQRLIMSDGTPELRFLDPDTLKEIRRITVTYNGRPVANVNELEWVKGRIYANVWHTNVVVRIDPGSGEVTGVINLAGLLEPSEQPQGSEGVLNGIAYDAVHDRLFVTGKNWPKVFEIRIFPKVMASHRSLGHSLSSPPDDELVVARGNQAQVRIGLRLGNAAGQLHRLGREVGQADELLVR